MALWPEEYEGFRDEARQMADALRGYLGRDASDEVATDPAGRVAAMRAALAPLEVTSPAGTDETIEGVPCRVFRPKAASRGTYLHFHGGAMILGSPLMNDTANADLCQRLGVLVISVDYRLAPEDPFPAGSDDCLAVSRWALEHTDGPIVLGGESAGGYFAALTALRVPRRSRRGAPDLGGQSRLRSL